MGIAADFVVNSPLFESVSLVLNLDQTFTIAMMLTDIPRCPCLCHAEILVDEDV